jgi:hypothetical protein
MSKINHLTEAEFEAVEAEIAELRQKFDAFVAGKLNGRVPANIIDRSIAVKRALFRLKDNLMILKDDLMRERW